MRAGIIGAGVAGLAAARRLQELGHEVTIFDFSGATHLDDSAAMVVDRLVDIANEERTRFILMGLSGAVAHVLHAMGVLQRVPEGHLVETLAEARQTAGKLLEE